jgi:hypothetical protein
MAGTVITVNFWGCFQLRQWRILEVEIKFHFLATKPKSQFKLPSKVQMNIFFTDPNPEKAAMALSDKHVVKMVTESVQMLCTAHHIAGSATEQMMKPAYVNHPCNVWVRESASNYSWLFDHATAIYYEYKERYDGKIHKSGQMLTHLIDVPKNIGSKGLTDPPQAMPAYFREAGACGAYRRYYALGKNHICSWERSPNGTPNWITKLRDEEYYFYPLGERYHLLDNAGDTKRFEAVTPIYLPISSTSISFEGEIATLKRHPEVCPNETSLMLHGGLLRKINGHPASVFEDEGEFA